MYSNMLHPLFLSLSFGFFTITKTSSISLQNADFNEPSNLIEHLNIFSECLVHIVNFARLNFVLLKQPIVLSFYQFVFNSRSNKLLILLVRNGPDAINNAKIFNYFFKTDYSTGSKPWLCEAHLFLKPPSPSDKKFRHYYLGQYNPNKSFYQLWAPLEMTEFWKTSKIWRASDNYENILREAYRVPCTRLVYTVMALSPVTGRRHKHCGDAAHLQNCFFFQRSFSGEVFLKMTSRGKRNGSRTTPNRQGVFNGIG